MLFRSSEWKGRPLLINFWATWCDPCRREIPLLKKLRHERAAHALRVVAGDCDRPGRPRPARPHRRAGVVHAAGDRPGTTQLTTTFVSSTQLSATGTAANAGIFSVTVVNPDPGSSSSNALNLQVGGSQQASDRKSTRLNSSHRSLSRMPSSA